MKIKNKDNDKSVAVKLNKPPMTTPAQNLVQAVAYLDEFSTLVFADAKEITADSASPNFYVNRPDNQMDDLLTQLLTGAPNEKILFSGHMGSGKSTELNRFAAQPELQKKFMVIKYSISEVLNIIDIDYLDFLISFATYLYIRASEEGITFDNAVLDSIEKWIKYFKSNVTELEEEDEASMVKRISSFFKRVSMILLRELALRDKIREVIRRNINGLVSVINTLVNAIKGHLGQRELLIIIDDLEKIPDIVKAEELFINAGTYMTMPMCKIIYTVPIALYYSIQFKQLTNTFGSSYFLPNIKVEAKNQQGERIPSPYMREFITKRMDPSNLDPQALDLIIQYSAGVPRECIRILKGCCIKSISRKKARIEPEIVFMVIAEMRNEFDRILSKEHFEILTQIQSGQKPPHTKTLMELFHSKVLLEYINGKRWIAINPIVKSLLEEQDNPQQDT